MVKTYFEDFYYEETSNYFIDVFNLIYVAFTRAVSTLIIHSPMPKEDKNNSGKATTKPVEYLFKAALNNISGNPVFADCWNHDQTRFTYGEIKKSLEKTETINAEKSRKYVFNDFSNRISLKNSASEYLSADENNVSLKNTGNVIHEILSKIQHVNDIEKACIKAYHAGKIDKSESIEIQQKLEISFTNPLIRHWFDDNYKTLTERTLLTPNDFFRPDRIMINEKEVVVVDYKTGNLKHEKYNRQVARYANLLKASGFENVSGYIWYIAFNDVEQVC